ncbi:MAG: hypothetical protein KAR42_13620 [candidate division Zixibacteria bacterium]|nr:hypothetical protein [candidate division Zixibacteria bacterium]
MMRKSVVVLTGLCLIVLIVVFGLPAFGKSKLSGYKDLCKVLKNITGDSISHHYIIYINLEACLPCSESMEWWHKLEKKIPECGGSFTFWASQKDSLDVAVALRLEGFATPVRVIRPDILKALKLQDIASPLKLLIKKNGEPVLVKNPVTKKAPKDFEKEVLKIVCEGD